MDWAETIAGQDEIHFSFGSCCGLYQRFMVSLIFILPLFCYAECHFISYMTALVQVMQSGNISVMKLINLIWTDNKITAKQRTAKTLETHHEINSILIIHQKFLKFRLSPTSTRALAPWYWLCYLARALAPWYWLCNLAKTLAPWYWLYDLARTLASWYWLYNLAKTLAPWYWLCYLARALAPWYWLCNVAKTLALWYWLYNLARTLA